MSVKRKDGVRFEGGLFNDDGTIRTGLNRSDPPFHPSLASHPSLPSHTSLLSHPSLPSHSSVPYRTLLYPVFAIKHLPSQYTLSIHPLNTPSQYTLSIPTLSLLFSAKSEDDDDHWKDRKGLLLAPHEDGTAKFHSKAGKAYLGTRMKRQEDLQYLKSGKGCSYMVDPINGEIPPWGVQVGQPIL